MGAVLDDHVVVPKMDSILTFRPDDLAGIKLDVSVVSCFASTF